MESLIHSIFEYTPYAHYLLFFLLMLGGLNIPISEDLILLLGGIIASTYVPENTTILFFWLYIGCILSAWEAYWLGRIFGPKLYEYKTINRIFNRDRMNKLNGLYERYGFLTFFVGRYIPGGIRNCLFMTAGMGPMPFGRFVLRDSVACFFSTATLFTIGFLFGEHHEEIFRVFKLYQKTCVILLLSFLLLVLFFKKVRKKSDLPESFS